MSEQSPQWVEVVYALPERQFLRRLPHVAGLSASAAIEASGVLDAWPELRGSRWRLAVYGEPVDPECTLQPGDRVELLRPLRVDPREARRRRVERGPGGRGRRGPR